MLRNRVLLFVGFFFLKKNVIQNIQGVKGEIFPALSSAFALYEVVNVKIRVINQCELFRFIIVNVHLCQATLC